MPLNSYVDLTARSYPRLLPGGMPDESWAGFAVCSIMISSGRNGGSNMVILDNLAT